MPSKSEIHKIKELVKKGKKQGFLSSAEILEVFPRVEEKVELLDHLHQLLLEEKIDLLECVRFLT